MHSKPACLHSPTPQENQSDCTAALPRLKTLLISGGDERLLLNPETGYNRYYCPPYPEDCQAAFGSTTASAISRSSYDKLKQYRNHLLRQLPCLHSTGLYEQEMQQLRLSFLDTGEFETNSRPDLIFAASGTDALYIAARLCASLNNQPLSILMIEPTESGRGVPDALKGQWGTHQPTLHSDSPPSSITRTNLPDVYAIPFRQPDGSLRNSQEIDAGFVTLAEKAIASNRRVLIVLTDVSKTGGLAPGLACCLKLAQQYPNNIHLLVDACQFRISPQTLKAYLSHGFMIALTGSKFLTGPAFSGALLIPDRLKERYRQGPFPEELAGYGARGDWPENWPWRSKLPERANFGLLFRWTAALEEWKAFLELPHTSLVPFLFQFREALLKRFHKDPLFELLPVPDIHRQPLSIQDSWDSIQTIFPFRLYHNGPDPIHLSRHETQQTYKSLQLAHSHPQSTQAGSKGSGLARYQLGQPVYWGANPDACPGALRLSLSSRLIIEAVSGGALSRDNVIQRALNTLDRIAVTIHSLQAFTSDRPNQDLDPVQ